MDDKKSSNFRLREDKISMIVLHSISEKISGKECIDFIEQEGLSYHYFIDTKGEIINTLDEDLVAFHAGKSKWRDLTNINNYSIGVTLMVEGNNTYSEFLNKIKKKDTFKPDQYQALELLCSRLMMRYPLITINRIVRHSDISGKDVRPDPKYDIGSGFNFEFFKSMLTDGIEKKYIPIETVKKKVNGN